MRGKEYLLLLLSTAVSLALALGAYRIFAPELVGVPADLRVVQLDQKVPPFFSNIIRDSDLRHVGFLINDPVTGVRAKPGLPALSGVGPHDLLGFRNSSIPVKPDIVVIGDSQTYGINALMSNSYPERLQQYFGAPIRIYSMAVGGWSSLQYLEMVRRAVVFEPQLVIINLYTGNDILETFRTAYTLDYWQAYRPNGELTLGDAPAVVFPPPEDDRVLVEFIDGSAVSFTPRLRLNANDRSDPVIRSGISITQRAISEMLKILRENAIESLFVIIPSKELAFGKKIAAGASGLPRDHIKLIKDETENIGELGSFIRAEGGKALSLVDGLAEAVFEDISCYPTDTNGHPNARGYDTIAQLVHAYAEDSITKIPDGFYRVAVSESEVWHFRVRNHVRYELSTQELATLDVNLIQDISHRALSRLPLLGH